MKRIVLFLALTACAWSQPTMPFANWKSAASGAFDPLSIDTLWVYYDAAQIAGKSDGDTLYYWKNLGRGGAQYDLYQTTGSLKPTYSTSTLLGTASVLFDGTDDQMVSPAAPYAVDYTNGTVFAVVRISGTTASNQMGLITQGDLWIIPFWGNNGVGSIYRHPNPTPAVNSAPHVLSQSIRIYEFSRKADSMWVAINDTITKEGGKSGGLGTGNNALQVGTLTTNYFRGRVAKILIYRNALSLADRQRVAAWLKQQYGLI